MKFYKTLIIFLMAIFTVIKAETMCNSGTDCKNNGVCNIEIKNGQTESYCSCQKNFHGPKCEYRKCSTNPCQNGGICESFGGRSIKCHCSKFYGGDFCEYKLPTACDIMDCGNGKCILLADSLDLADCECNEGFSGKYCSIVEACKLDSCNFRGECVSDGAKSFSCKCHSGFTGEFCKNQIDYCKNHACYPGSKCINEIGYAKCECQQGRVGRFCEREDPCAKENVCNSRGKCFGTYSGEHSCLCQRGYVGQNCETDIDECAVGSICGENGQCENTDGGYFCKCDENYSGRHCSIKTEPYSYIPASNILPVVSAIICFTLVLAIIIVCYILIDRKYNSGKYKVDQKTLSSAIDLPKTCDV